ncbi:MAG: Acetylornithine deacetylase [Haliscomenobacter sp.]|jgi:acetylornithine deacetylase|nr:Acetylornithine deacetylase [Haliscomenobacter sp.]
MSAIDLLKRLIATPSFSKEEFETAGLLLDFLEQHSIQAFRKGNNVWARSDHWDEAKPVLLLNSHHDTVKPVSSWTRDPFSPAIEDGRLYGLGSNDAGASLVSLIAVFLELRQRTDLAVNLLLAASAEEEISGAGGIAALLPDLGRIDAAIVGEPTSLRMAVAERGLMVIDAEAIGKAGHAARDEGVNAIYLAADAIQKIRELEPEQVSPLLGKVKITVTQIEAGHQHNVVPDLCRLVIDVRSNECYQNEALFQWLQERLDLRLNARSFRLNASGIPLDHPLVQSGRNLGLPYFGSPTLSDQALMPFPSLKIGCGDSARSHTADEYIELQEIAAGISVYRDLILGLNWDYKK